MGFADFRQRMLAGERLVGTFLKTPAYELIEVLAATPIDFLCLDAEHSSFDRARMDACLAMARALDFPVLVRVGSATPENILQALDSGAVGVVCPHIDSVEKARGIAKAARFGRGGRGYAGSTRWAGYTRNTMSDLLAKSRDETIVIAQIEEPEGVAVAAEIAGTEGIDGLFVGPADLSIAYGKTNQESDELMTAFAAVGKATKAAGKAFVTFVGTGAAAAKFTEFGVHMFFIASEHGWMAASAAREAEAARESGS